MMSRFARMLLLPGLLAALGCEPKPAVPTPGTTTSGDVRRDVDEAAETAVEFSQEKKEEFQKKLDEQIQGVEAEIAKLREKGGELKDEAKTDWDQKMADLETKRDAARAKLAEVGASTAEAWKDVQKGAQSAWEELDQAFREASREF